MPNGDAGNGNHVHLRKTRSLYYFIQLVQLVMGHLLLWRIFSCTRQSNWWYLMAVQWSMKYQQWDCIIWLLMLRSWTFIDFWMIDYCSKVQLKRFSPMKTHKHWINSVSYMLCSFLHSRPSYPSCATDMSLILSFILLQNALLLPPIQCASLQSLNGPRPVDPQQIWPMSPRLNVD